MKRIERSDHVRYLTFSCYRKLPLFGNDTIKDAFAEEIMNTKRRMPFKLHAWVIMPDHVHLLLRTLDDPIPRLLRSLKSAFASSVIDRWRSLNAPVLGKITDRSGRTRIWQSGGGYDRNLWFESEIREKTEYIHNNPVRAGLVALTDEWTWSSAQWWAGDRSGPVACDQV